MKHSKRKKIDYNFAMFFSITNTMNTPYTTGTLLSYASGSECATVVSENLALVTMYNGSKSNMLVELKEWLSTSNGREQEDFIPIPRETEGNDDNSPCSKEVCSSAFKVYAAGRISGSTHDEMVSEHTETFRSCNWCNPNEMPCFPSRFCGKAYSVYMAGKVEGKNRIQISKEENEAFQACETCNPKTLIESYPIGTILRWNHEVNGEESRRTAVITKLGVLQVMGFYTDELHGTPLKIKCYEKVLFPSIAKWRESLPGYGSVSISQRVPSNKESIKPLESLTDYEALTALITRFNVRQKVHLYKSPLEIHAIDLKSLECSRDFLATRTLEKDLENPGLRKDVTDILIRQIETYNNYKVVLDAMTETEKNYHHPFDIYPMGQSRLYAYVNRKKHLISTYDGKIAIVGRPIANTFEESGIDYCNGKPILVAVYRKKEIKLY
jgi:hypothetical protein